MYSTSRKQKFLPILIILMALITYSVSIAVPITKNEFRCMVVYTSSEDEDIKIDVRFPKLVPLPNQQQHEEYFMIWVNNTETFQADYYRVEQGQTFRRQLSLQPNIMYKVCFRLETASPQRGTQYIDIEYESYHQFKIMNHDRHNIKVPDSILKQQDFKDSYDDALMMLEMTERQLQLNKIHQRDQLSIFQYINSRTQYLILVSSIQIGFILVVAVVQFYVIRKHLVGELRM